MLFALIIINDEVLLMTIGEKLTTEVKAWGTLAIVIVIVSLVLVKFKTSNVGSMTCPGLNSSHAFYNVSLDQCCLGSTTLATDCTATGNLTAINSLAGTADTFVSALSEPKNWVAIVIIAIVGFAMLKLFTGKKGDD